MPGIGISPCPPFNNMPGVPGILYDGNTVAWYDFKDSRTVNKDGANRVNAWLNKINLTIGAELVNQATWFTPAYWTGVFDPNWSQVGNTLVSDGNNGFARRAAFFTVGITYKITVTIIRNAGTFRISDGAFDCIIANASGTYTAYLNATAVNLNLNSNLFNGSVTALSIKQVSGPTLVQYTGANQPLWSASGILFDGVNDFLKTQTFAFVKPEMIYLVCRQLTWTITDRFFDGNLGATVLMNQTGVSPGIGINAGVGIGPDNNLVLNTFGIIRALFNGVNSSLQVNLNAAILGDTGVNDANGFCVGSNGVGTALWSNIEVKEIILRRIADTSTNQLLIYNFLKRVNGV